MALTIEAVYENGVLKPAEPLRRDHEFPVEAAADVMAAVSQRMLVQHLQRQRQRGAMRRRQVHQKGRAGRTTRQFQT